MDVDRRTLLISLTSTAATLALPKHALGALATECFAAARKDDRGNFSAALFSLNGDMRSVELPGRGTTSRFGLTAGTGWHLRGVLVASGSPFRLGQVSQYGSPPSPTGISLAMACSRLTADCSTRRRTTMTAHAG